MRDTYGMSEYLYVTAAILLTLCIYLPNLGNTFNGMDVPVYIPILEHSDLWTLVKTSFNPFANQIVSGYYAPLASIALTPDRLFSSSPDPQAKIPLIINLLIHCLNGGLVYYFLRRLGISCAVSSGAALIFLIHPLQATSILWFAERKTVLSTAFSLLSCINYTSFQQDGRGIFYWLCMLFFVLAVLTKPNTVILPIVLIGLDILNQAATNGGVGLGRRFIGSLRRLWPFFLIVALSVWLTLQTEKTDHLPFPWSWRPFIAAGAVWFYVFKVIAPVNLTYVYPKWNVSLSNWTQWAVLLSMAPLGVLLYMARNLRIPALAAALFFIPLVPALGFVPFGWYLRHSYVADHFCTYR